MREALNFIVFRYRLGFYMKSLLPSSGIFEAATLGIQIKDAGGKKLSRKKP
jgi:hypothetical protein